MKALLMSLICLIAVSVSAEDKKIYSYHRTASCLAEGAFEDSEDVIQKLLDEGYLIYKKELVYPYKFSVYTFPLPESVLDVYYLDPEMLREYAALPPELVFEFILANPLELIIIKRQKEFYYDRTGGITKAERMCKTAYFGRVGFAKNSPYYISAVEEELKGLFYLHKHFIIHAPLKESELSKLREEIRILEKEKCSAAVSEKMTSLFKKNKLLIPSFIYECE